MINIQMSSCCWRMVINISNIIIIVIIIIGTISGGGGCGGDNIHQYFTLFHAHQDCVIAIACAGQGGIVVTTVVVSI